MYCPNCGTQCAYHGKFCENCGAPKSISVSHSGAGSRPAYQQAVHGQAQPLYAPPVSGMTCHKCGSSNVYVSASTFAKSKSRSFLWNLLWILLTGGLWIIWMIIRKRKEKIVTVKTALCNNCGTSWNI